MLKSMKSTHVYQPGEDNTCFWCGRKATIPATGEHTHLTAAEVAERQEARGDKHE